MGALTTTSIRAGGDIAVTVNTLTASDTVTLDFNNQPIMYIDNVTAGSLTLNLDGADSATISVDGYGTVDPTSGLDITVGAGAQKAIKLNSRSKYLQGVVTITGGDGAEVVILEQ
jgi:hypothetical protein